MTSVLFTSITFKDYAGSEIATLEQMKYFISRNWEVHLFTLQYDTPLINHLPSEATIYTPNDIHRAPTHYDLIISRQYPLLDYLLFCKMITADKVYYESVGYKNPNDAFPAYYKDLTLTGTVSELTKNELEKRGTDTTHSYICPNSANESSCSLHHNVNKEIKTIAVVSNHPPYEIEHLPLAAAQIGIDVTIFGMHHQYVFITPELLNRFDVIISIGKTIYNSLALGIPSFMYDENVSDGYVTIENFQEVFSCNFARKSTYSKLNTTSLLNSIISGYSRAVLDSAKLRKLSKNLFSSNIVFDKLLSEIYSRPTMNYPELYRKWAGIQAGAGAFVEQVYFDKQEIQRWYEKSLELGNLYQNEIQKYTNSYRENEQYRRQLESIFNSKSWKIIKAIRALINIFR